VGAPFSLFTEGQGKRHASLNECFQRKRSEDLARVRCLSISRSSVLLLSTIFICTTKDRSDVLPVYFQHPHQQADRAGRRNDRPLASLKPIVEAD